MNGHVENFDKKIFDEFHNVNAHINFINGWRVMGKNSASAYNDNAQ